MQEVVGLAILMLLWLCDRAVYFAVFPPLDLRSPGDSRPPVGLGRKGLAHVRLALGAAVAER